MAETKKAHDRRMETGWFDEYVREPILDIGSGGDPLTPTARQYDVNRGDPDATTLRDIPDECFGTVYASHVLEHLVNPTEAVMNWWRVLRPGGWLIVCVPHADLYEKKDDLPSRWNGDHKTFWLPDADDPRLSTLLHFRSLLLQIEIATGLTPQIEILNAGWVGNGPEHAGGEYSIEARVQKPFVSTPEDAAAGKKQKRTKK